MSQRYYIIKYFNDDLHDEAKYLGVAPTLSHALKYVDKFKETLNNSVEWKYKNHNNEIISFTRYLRDLKDPMALTTEEITLIAIDFIAKIESSTDIANTYVKINHDNAQASMYIDNYNDLIVCINKNELYNNVDYSNGIRIDLFINDILDVIYGDDDETT